MRKPSSFIATCGYVGYVPVAPGTAGSIAGRYAHLVLRLLLWAGTPVTVS